MKSVYKRGFVSGHSFFRCAQAKNFFVLECRRVCMVVVQPQDLPNWHAKGLKKYLLPQQALFCGPQISHPADITSATLAHHFAHTHSHLVTISRNVPFVRSTALSPTIRSTTCTSDSFTRSFGKLTATTCAVSCTAATPAPVPMTHTTDGWTPERVIACAVRELRTAVMCDFHCANGSYDVNPDHVGYPHARPTSVASFRDMWGSLCFTDGPTLEFTDILHIASR